MDADDIEDLIDHYGRSARHAKEGGFDGIEIHAAYGRLLAQFLSPLSNYRDDEYGGSLSARMRLIRQVLRRVRAEVGEQFPLGFRISADEFAPGGMTLDDTVEVCRALVTDDQIDFFDVSGGRPPYSYARALPTFDQPQAHLAPLAGAIRAAVTPVPVLVIGRIVDPLVGEQVLAEGQADMVGMLRGHVADPELANKAKEGRLDEIKYCVSCNQECFARISQGRPIACIQNPITGREDKLSIFELRRAKAAKRVVVIGGGPAGLEAAWVAAKRGHQVELHERETQLGGQARLHSLLPRRSEFGNVIANLERLVARHGVDVRLGSARTADEIVALGADVVIVATGSIPRKDDVFREWRPDLPGLPGSDGAHVLTSWDVLLGRKPLGRKVVMLDGEGRHEAAVTAEFLAEQGVDLEIVTPFAHFAPALAATLELPAVYSNLLRLGVVISPWCLPVRIEAGTVVVRQIHTGEERRIEEVDSVVVHGGSRSDDGLHRALVGRVERLHAVGDCVQPRRIAHAMYQAHLVAREI